MNSSIVISFLLLVHLSLSNAKAPPAVIAPLARCPNKCYNTKWPRYNNWLATRDCRRYSFALCARTLQRCQVQSCGKGAYKCGCPKVAAGCPGKCYPPDGKGRELAIRDCRPQRFCFTPARRMPYPRRRCVVQNCRTGSGWECGCPRGPVLEETA